MFVLGHRVTSDFLSSAVYCLAETGVNIFTLVSSNCEICGRKFCELPYTDRRNSTCTQNRRLVLSMLSNFLILKRLKDNTKLSFILEREDHHSSFFVFTECAPYLLDCVCPCVHVCMCISNNNAFINTDISVLNIARCPCACVCVCVCMHACIRACVCNVRE
jgi:hypothetical protein